MAASIQFSAGIDLAAFQRGAAKMQATMARVSARVRNISAAAFTAAGATAVLAFTQIARAAGSAGRQVTGALALGDSLDELSARTGIGAGKLYLLQNAFKLNGVEAEKVGATINKMQRALAEAADGSKAAVQAFDNIGLGAQGLLALAPDQQFLRIAESISSIADPGRRAQAALAIFGGGGGELMALFQQGAIASATSGLQGAAAVLDRSAGSFGTTSDRLEKAGARFQGFWIGLADSALGGINGALERIEGTDFLAKGQAVGAMVADTIRLAMQVPGYLRAAGNFLASGITSAIGYAAQLANILWDAAARFGDALAAAWHAGASGVSQIAAGLMALPLQLAEKISTSLEWAFQKALEFFGNAFFDLVAAIGAALEFALRKASNAVVSVMPERLKKWMGVSAVKDKSFAEISAANKASLAGNKTGYAAESFADISARNQGKIREMLPGYTAMIDGVWGAAKDSADAAEAAWERATGKTRDLVDPATIAAFHSAAKDLGATAVAEWKNAATPPAAPSQPGLAAPAAPPDKWARFRKFSTFKGPSDLSTRGIDPETMTFRSLKMGESRNMRTGLITPRVAGLGGGPKYLSPEEKQAAKEKKMIERAEAEKRKSIQGTNDRLDTLIKSQQAVEAALA